MTVLLNKTMNKNVAFQTNLKSEKQTQTKKTDIILDSLNVETDKDIQNTKEKEAQIDNLQRNNIFKGIHRPIANKTSKGFQSVTVNNRTDKSELERTSENKGKKRRLRILGNLKLGLGLGILGGGFGGTIAFITAVMINALPGIGSIAFVGIILAGCVASSLSLFPLSAGAADLDKANNLPR